MPYPSVAIALPIRERSASNAFYREVLGIEASGEELGSDGLPEPLQFVLNDGMRVVLVPTVGFGWVVGDRDVAPDAVSECALRLERDSSADVDALVARARSAGGAVVTEPLERWGFYEGAFADPDGHVWIAAAPLHR